MCFTKVDIHGDQDQLLKNFKNVRMIWGERMVENADPRAGVI